MIDIHYRQSALFKYGEACELCGHRTSLEVHHIDYQEHQEMENKLRKAIADKDMILYQSLVQKAIDMGYDKWVDGQLSKNDSTLNLSVLCGNCHSQCHLIDYGKNILKALEKRR